MSANESDLKMVLPVIQDVSPKTADASLFDSVDYWRFEPKEAFKSLLSSIVFAATSNSQVKPPERQTMRKNSADVYGLMFQNFLNHLADRNAAFMTATPGDIDAFLSGPLGSATKETCWRYIRLLERVYDHLVTKEALTSNPVTDWVRSRIDSGESPRVGRNASDPTTVRLEDVLAIQDWLLEQGKREIDEGRWRVARDLTLASLSLGTGMRCSELVKLARWQVNYEHVNGGDHFEFWIPESATVVSSREHRTVADLGCLALMKEWCDCRWSGFPKPPPKPKPRIDAAGVIAREESAPANAEIAQPPSEPTGVILLPGSLVFPATLAGSALGPATVFKNLKDLASEAGKRGILRPETIWVLSQGASGLRRAYALTQLQAGTEAEVLRERMGLHKLESVVKYFKAAGLKS